MYVLFAVINNTKKVKIIVNKLKELGIKGATIIDTMGSNSFCSECMTNMTPLIYSSKAIDSNPVYNKTIISVIQCEKHVYQAIDAIEEILGGDLKKPNTGIIFTLPVIGFLGGALGKYIIEHGHRNDYKME
jgi:nitrogen regulatory protein PII